MHIFIDESGSFQIPSPLVPKVSCVVALCIPSSALDQLFERFARLKRQISPKDAELKGSRLTEPQETITYVASYARSDSISGIISEGGSSALLDLKKN